MIGAIRNVTLLAVAIAFMRMGVLRQLHCDAQNVELGALQAASRRTKGHAIKPDHRCHKPHQTFEKVITKRIKKNLPRRLI